MDTYRSTTHQRDLDDPRWHARRIVILNRDLHRCRNCQSTGTLHVHHRQYHRHKATGETKRLWDYPSHLLLSLCPECHDAGHKQFTIPVFDV